MFQQFSVRMRIEASRAHPSFALGASRAESYPQPRDVVHRAAAAADPAARASQRRCETRAVELQSSERSSVRTLPKRRITSGQFTTFQNARTHFAFSLRYCA